MTEEIMKGFYKINLTIPRGGFESFIDAWLIKNSNNGVNILFETGPACAVADLLKELKNLGAEKIDYLVYTHIHLDHAGGLGQFVNEHSETKVLVPAGSAKHLINPAQLAEKSVTALGNLCDVYGKPIGVPEDIFVESVPGVEIIPTAGHAPFHNSYIYHHNGKKILFAGEAAGCIFALDDKKCFMRPATPHKFFYNSAVASLEKIKEIKDVDLYCFPHSGCFEGFNSTLEQSQQQMKLWLEILSALPQNSSVENGVKAVMENDPEMKKLVLLSEDVRRREEFFIRQSVKGYLGWIERCRAGK